MLLNRKSKDVHISIPIDTGRLLCERAEERWHTRANVVQGDRRKTIQVFPPGMARMGVGHSPIGSFVLVMSSPLPSQATISRIEWDPDHNGTEDSIRQAINSLVGWPIANPTITSYGRPGMLPAVS